MPSYSQLEAEPWWGREIVTDELDWLGDELCRRTGQPRDAFGSKGNNVHLSGGHRSQEWILNSDWCTNTSYTVQSGLTSTQARHIAAGDFTPGAWGTSSNRALVAKHTKALFAAARSGQLTGVRQIFGTLDGRNPTGLNVLSNSTTTPDSSHVDHLHITFDRRYMRDIALMTRIADIITGDDMAPTDVQEIWQNYLARNGRAMADNVGETWQAAQQALSLLTVIAQKVDISPAELDAIKAAAAAGAETGARAALAGLSAQEIAEAISDEVAADVADLLAARLAQ
jgi:hypothetical protein